MKRPDLVQIFTNFGPKMFQYLNRQNISISHEVTCVNTRIMCTTNLHNLFSHLLTRTNLTIYWNATLQKFILQSTLF